MYIKVISKIKEINKILNVLKYFMKKISQELKKCLGIRKAKFQNLGQLGIEQKFENPRIMPSKPRDPICLYLMLMFIAGSF